MKRPRQEMELTSQILSKGDELRGERGMETGQEGGGVTSGGGREGRNPRRAKPIY